MTPSGGGAGGTLLPWNEYQLVVSLALRQANNDRAVAVKHLWLNPDNAPQKTFGSFVTLTNNPSSYAPAFWVQQAQFFNGDFRNDPGFQFYFDQQASADKLYSSTLLAEPFRYGLTAGEGPSGYHADRLFDHPGEVFSPEAVSAFGDMNALLSFFMNQPPPLDLSYRYGMVRESDVQPAWIPTFAALVDHLFLLFGLTESLHPNFYADRLFAPILHGDYNFDGLVDAADYTVWRDTMGSTTDLRADGDMNGVVELADFNLWATAYNANLSPAETITTPEPSSQVLSLLLIGLQSRAFRRN